MYEKELAVATSEKRRHKQWHSRKINKIWSAIEKKVTP